MKRRRLSREFKPEAIRINVMMLSDASAGG
jgi:hypothetical protein